MNMKNDVRKLTDGAMMAAIIGVVLLIDRQTAGLLQGTVLFLFPLPMVFFGAKYGWKNSWMVYASVLILAAILSTPATLALMACESFIGMLYGCGIHDQIDTKKLLIRTMVASVLTEVLTSLVFASFFGYDPMGEVQELENLFSQSASQMNMELPASMNIEQLIMSILMVSVVFTGILEAFILHLLSRLLFRRLHIHIPPNTPLSLYEPPKWSGYLAICCTVCFYYALSQFISSDVLKMAMEGIGMIGMIYLSFYGIVATVLYLSIHTHMNKLVLVLLALFIMMLTSGLLMSMLGFLYITTDMHHKMMECGNKKQ